MSAKTNHVRIGIFVLLAVVLFIAGLLAFGARSYFVSKSKFETAFPEEVYGLTVGSGVELRGVPIGKVTRIAFPWSVHPGSKSSAIIVEFEVEGELLPLPPGETMASAVERSTKQGLRALLKTQGITGTSKLALEHLNPTNNPPLALDYTPNALFIPSAPGQFTRMLESIEKSLRNIQELDFAGIGQGVTNALGAVNKLSDKIDQIDLNRIATNADSLLVEVRVASVKLQGAIDEVRGTIKDMKLDKLGQNADQFVVGLQETNVKLQKVLSQVGTVPMSDTVSDIRQTIQTLNEVLVELKRYPSGFLLGKPPLPARSVQPATK